LLIPPRAPRASATAGPEAPCPGPRLLPRPTHLLLQRDRLQQQHVAARRQQDASAAGVVGCGQAAREADVGVVVSKVDGLDLGAVGAGGGGEGPGSGVAGETGLARLPGACTLVNPHPATCRAPPTQPQPQPCRARAPVKHVDAVVADRHDEQPRRRERERRCRQHEWRARRGAVFASKQQHARVPREHAEPLRGDRPHHGEHAQVVGQHGDRPLGVLLRRARRRRAVRRRAQHGVAARDGGDDGGPHPRHLQHGRRLERGLRVEVMVEVGAVGGALTY
jgi:hypothetical protein